MPRLVNWAVAGVAAGTAAVVLAAMLEPARTREAADDEATSSDAVPVRAVKPAADGIVDLGVPEELDAEGRLALALSAGREEQAEVTGPAAAEAPPELRRFRDLVDEPVRKLSPQLIKRCLEVVRDLDPQLAPRLEAIVERDPETFERIVSRGGRRWVGLAQLKASNPELYELKVEELKADREVTRLAAELRELRHNPSPGQTALTGDLEEDGASAVPLHP